MILRSVRTMHAMGLARLLCCAAAALGATLARVPVLAQAPQGRVLGEAPDEIRFSEQLRSIVSDTLARSAMLDLRRKPEPSQDDFRRAAAALRLARRLDSDNLFYARLEREAWQSAAEPERVNELHSIILKLDPEDTVSLLGAINARLSGIQTVEKRLAAYERFVGPDASAIDPAVRSRLALDAALLARDAGNDGLFLDQLTLSTTLDPTNKEAATLFASMFLDRASDPLDRVEILCNVVLADPLDLAPLLNLTHELMRHGAFVGANRTLTIYELIARKTDPRQSVSLILDRVLINWNAGGPQAALDYLSSLEQDVRRRDEERRARLFNEGFEPGPRPAGYLVPTLESVRLAVHVGRRDGANARQALQALAESVERVVDPSLAFEEGAGVAALVEGGEEGEEISPRRRIEARLTLVWGRLFAGEELQSARTLLDRVIAEAEDSGTELNEDAIARFNAWFDVHAGQTERAREVLQPLAENDLQAQWALATSYELDGLGEEATAAFADIIVRDPASALASAARERIARLIGRRLAPTATATRLDDYINEFAPWLPTLVAQPEDSFAVEVRFRETAVALSQPILLDVRIRNRLRWPLAVGTDRPVPSRMLIVPKVQLPLAGGAEQPVPAAALARIDSRLRLEPNESVTVTVPLQLDWVGELMTRFPFGRATLRARVIPGFVLDADRQPQANPFVPTAITLSLLNRSGQNPGVSIDQLTGLVLNGPSPNCLVAADLGLILVLQNRSADEGGQAYESVIAAIASRITDLGPLEQAFLVLRMHAFGPPSMPEADRPLTRLFDAGVRVETLDLSSPYVVAALTLAGVSVPDSAAALEDEIIGVMAPPLRGEDAGGDESAP